MAAACALAIISGKNIFIFGIAERLRTLRYSIFTGGGTPSGREPLVKPETLRLSREVYCHVKGPIPEGAVAVGDWGS